MRDVVATAEGSMLHSRTQPGVAGFPVAESRAAVDLVAVACVDMAKKSLDAAMLKHLCHVAFNRLRLWRLREFNSRLADHLRT